MLSLRVGSWTLDESWRNLFLHAKRQFWDHLLFFWFFNKFLLCQISLGDNLPPTIHWLAISGIHEYCMVLGPLDDCFRKHHSGLDDVLRYFLRHTRQVSLSLQRRKLYCTLPIHRKSICVKDWNEIFGEWSSLGKFEENFLETYLGGHAWVLHWATIDSGRWAALQSDSSTSAPFKRFLHVGTDIL
jgi:hypothetical protein